MNNKSFYEELLHLIQQKNDLRHFDKIKQLVKNIKSIDNINIKNEYGNTLLMYITDADIAKMLIQAGTEINTQNNFGRTALIHATYSGNLDLVNVLISYDADPNITDDDGNNPLFWADYALTNLEDKEKHLKIIDALIKANIDLDHRDNLFEATALIWSAKRGNKEVTKKLIAAGANLNITDDENLTALDWSLKNNHSEIVEMLKSAQNKL